jgi:hypothetical protein
MFRRYREADEEDSSEPSQTLGNRNMICHTERSAGERVRIP